MIIGLDCGLQTQIATTFNTLGSGKVVENDSIILY
jgi:hypothetical protein